LTTTGAYLYLNQNGSSWAPAVQIAATAAAPYTVGTNTDPDFISFRNNAYLSLLSNNGSGIFTESTLASTSTSTSLPASIAYAPAATTAKTGFIFLAAGAAGSHSIIQRSNTTFATPTGLTSSILPPNVLKVLAKDIDGDHFVDFALIPKSGSTIELYQNTTDTSFPAAPTAILTRTAIDGIQDAAFTDLNSDGKADLLLATASGLQLYTGNGKFTGLTANTSVTPKAISTVASSIVPADFTGDGNPDIFMSVSGANSILLVQTGSLTFSDITSTAFGNLLTGGTIAAYAADIDGNGYMDILELKSDGSIAVHTNNLKKK
ncbi:MAG: cell wall-associated hydrolase, partial [Bacteriovoracaceae bacterium]|nr:cell wall-associated hydrolase [Bacteriovoracaceae bacterium]